MTQPSAPVAHADPNGGVAARVAAFIVALCVLIGGAVFSLGTVLFAPLGMAVATYVWRRRGRVLPIVGHWLAAVVSVMALLVILAAVGAGFVPSSTWTQLGHTMDSASVAQRQAAVARGMARATPRDTANATARVPGATSVTALTVMMSFGAVMLIIVFGAIFGSVGWAAGMLFGFAVKGRWPGAISSSA